MPYTFPNPPKLSIYMILEWMQKNLECIYVSKDLIDEFNISDTDAPTRLSRLRSMGFVKYYKLSEKSQGFILTDYGKRFKKNELSR